MRWNIVSPDQLIAADWTGGKTTELFIFPPSARYDLRDFEIRISTATVLEESSRFTSLPGFSRHIMVLDGALRLEHEGRRTAYLEPFDQDSFEGGWSTLGYGKCVDFNLMHTSAWAGELQFLRGECEVLCAANGFTGIFALTDGLSAVISDEGGRLSSARLDNGGFLLAEGGGLIEIRGEGRAVMARISGNH